MSIIIRGYDDRDLPAMCAIWNAVVEEGNAFPQEDPLDARAAERFFAEQSHVGVADENGDVVGLYILHPNNIGRCGHIANTSYAVKRGHRGRRIGERLVRDSMAQAARLSFRILQFNAVVATNERAIRLYTRLGFTQLGVIPGGFRLNDGGYVDILPFYIRLEEPRS